MSNVIGRPAYIASHSSSALAFARQLDIGHGAKEGGSLSEDWLQNIIHENPDCLPTRQIEPVFDQIIPVCRELRTPSGFLDNLYVTPEGYLVLAECKLWRNPEARRKVIAQIMDYAKDFSHWGYDDLIRAIRSVTKSGSDNPLYELVAEHSDAPDEATFVDRVSKNLKYGKHLLLIVGDGIQEGLEELTEFIQQHMSQHYTLALVELKLYRLKSDEDLLIIPNVLAKTVTIERAVIRIEDSSVKLTEQIERTTHKSATGSPKSLTENEFYESLDANIPGGTLWLQNLLPQLEERGISWDIKKTMILRYNPSGDRNFNLGYFETSGRFQTATATWTPNELGRVELAYEYLNQVANAIPNAYVKENTKPTEWYVRTDHGTLNVNDLKGHETEFLDAIDAYLMLLSKEGVLSEN